MVFNNPHQQVAGAQTQIADPNHPVEIYYGSAAYNDLKEMVSNLPKLVYPEDKVEAVPPPEMGLGSKIYVTRATPVMIIDAKKTNTYRTWTQTVGELLMEKKIELLGQDSADIPLASAISYAMKITITRVAEVEVKEKEVINFNTVKKNTVDLEKGQSEVDQKGINGEKEITYKVKRVDGEEVSREKINTEVTKESQTEIILIGIGPKLAKSGPYKDTVNAAAKEYLINGTALMCLMLAESGGSADTGYPDGQYKGLFQYDEGFWATASSQAGYGGASIYSAEVQIFTTAYQLTHGQSRRWPPWGACANK